MKPATEPVHETVIQPHSGWRAVNIRELVEYRDLLFFLVWRDLKAHYAQTVLGFSWAIIRPFFSMVVFSIVFGRLAGLPSDGIPYPLFAYVALVPWSYFSTTFANSGASLITHSHTWSKVYFPRLIIPRAPVIGGLVDFAIASTVIVLLMLWYGVSPAASVIYLPLLILLMVAAAAGVGIWLSALAVQFRDVRHASPFLAQLLLYAAPVVWPVSLISTAVPQHADVIRLVYGLYPMAGVIEGFRAALFGNNPMPWDLIVSGSFSATVLLVTGTFYFRRRERIFADVA
jgi:lipopolysaccharide transport system permease protein